MKAIWLSDLHLNWLDDAQIQDDFIPDMLTQSPDLILLSGDVADARSLVDYLSLFETELGVPICFVLGNHDIYHSSFAQTHQNVRRLTSRSSLLTWLTDESVVPVSHRTALIGHDGWADGRHGDFSLAPRLLNDYVFIDELAHLSNDERLRRLHALGDQAAQHVRRCLTDACKRYPQIYLLTHVPPFVKACLHEGYPSDAASLPHFSSKAMGDVLVEIMSRYPHCQLTALCGHTHSGCVVHPLPNLTVCVGEAEYERPVIQRVWEIS